MTRWKLVLEYDGGPYAGWQKQQGLKTVQGCVDDALHALFPGAIDTIAAGRTDAGVHAVGQVVHVDLIHDRGFDSSAMMRAVNAHLRNESIALVHAQIAPDDFHARFQATNKLYRYRIIARCAPVVLDTSCWHVYKPLDVSAMRQAATGLLGHHDFTSFRAADCQAKSPLRTLDRLSIDEDAYDPYDGQRISIEAEARSFLHHQVRNMTGTLVEIGQGKRAPDDVIDILAARNRSCAGITAPPQGLTLVRVDYGT